MATEFQMPKLGLTMESGTIMQWTVPDGSSVTAGTVVMVIETDKVESEIEVSQSGILHQTGAVGETYDCGVRIGWFLEAGEEPPAEAAPAVAPVGIAAAAPASGVAAHAAPPATPSGATRGDGGRILASPNARRVAASLGIDLRQVSGSGPGGRIVSEDVEHHSVAQPMPPAVASTPPASGASGRPASIAARQLADLLGVDLAEVPGRPGDARLSKDDVVLHVRQLIATARDGGAAEAVDGGSAPPLLQAPSKVVPLRGMRGTIASRMHQSLRDMAQLTLTVDADMSAVVADRAQRAGGDRPDAPAPGYTDYVIAAVARALQDHPYVNSQVTDDGVAHLPAVNVGLAVALDEGLIVPVVADTPSLDLAALSSETSRLADAARSGSLKLAELEGGTFSVTALGMYGVDAFTPVINPPNTAILGVGRLRDDIVWVDDQPNRRPTLTLSLTWDHRAFDGAPAAEFAHAVATRLATLDLE